MILEVKALSAGYGRKTILHDVSFSLESGTMTGLLGSNGSGKTTLLKSLCGLLPHTGQVTLHDPQLALNCCDRLLLLRDGCLLDALEPQQDSLEDMERKLSMVYGDLTLLRVNNKDGKPQLVLVR